MALSRRSKVVGAVCAGAALLALLVVQSQVCISAWARYGFSARHCPDGEVHQTVRVEAQGLRRGGPGPVEVSVEAHFATARSPEGTREPLPRFSAALSLVDGKGTATALQPDKDGWVRAGDGHSATVTLPEVADGDYKLRAAVKSAVGESTVDVPLPLYAPARVHVLTDRPLYEPGNTVLFRALVLKARELSPIDFRPGRWVVTSPSNEVLLEEQSPAAEWGVAKGSFPLDKLAQSGTWKVRWASGEASDEVSFDVRPFQLPRFRVELAPGKPFFSPGDKLALSGAVLYASGAPVARAKLTLEWRVDGAWPAPIEWAQGALPQSATAGADGRFTLSLPEVPRDLRGKVRVGATVTAVDEAQDSVTAAASLLLSEDALSVDAVTELEDGLLDGFNNRVYLRVSSADGTPLPGARVLVRRAWDPRDKGVPAEADEDGVAALQLDPGPAVNVVEPPMPVRAAPAGEVVTRTGLAQLAGGEASLADQLALDRAERGLAACAPYAEGAGTSALALAVNGGGTVTQAISRTDTPLDACVTRVLKAARLAAGPERALSVSFEVNGAHLPGFDVQVATAPEGAASPAWLQAAARSALLSARGCLPRSTQGGQLTKVAQLAFRPGVAALPLRWVSAPGERDTPVPAGVMACVQRAVTSLRVPVFARHPAGFVPGGEGEEGEEEAVESSGELLAVLDVSVHPGESADGEEPPQATTRLGYELKVTARVGDKDAGGTKLFLAPGRIPRVRLRATPTLVEPGGTVAVEVLRGPDYRGELAKGTKLYLMGERGEQLEAELDLKTRKASFALPAKASGWWQTRFENASAFVFVRGGARMTVAVKPSQPRYAPGQKAQLSILTRVDEQPAAAAVGLFGVDESLSQLAPLAGPDELGKLRPAAEMRAPAFGVLDAQALAMGRVRGANAAAATVVKVWNLPSVQDTAAPVFASAQSVFDPSLPLTEHFYGVLAELEDQARAWEAKAADGEQAGPELVAKLWADALSACAKRGEPVTDAFGRRLTLSRLPADLLGLTDPRRVVKNAARLPEDVVNWEAWVERERP